MSLEGKANGKCLRTSCTEIVFEQITSRRTIKWRENWNLRPNIKTFDSFAKCCECFDCEVRFWCKFELFVINGDEYFNPEQNSPTNGTKGSQKFEGTRRESFQCRGNRFARLIGINYRNQTRRQISIKKSKPNSNFKNNSIPLIGNRHPSAFCANQVDRTASECCNLQLNMLTSFTEINCSAAGIGSDSAGARTSVERD